MWITLMEVIDIIIMVAAIGFIFSGYIGRKPKENYDPLEHYNKNPWWEDLKFAAMIAGPAVVLHELSHKFVAMGFGAEATLHAPYTFYAIVILLKLINFPLLFIVGGYVTHTALPDLQSALVSLAGPLINLVLWGLCFFAVSHKKTRKKYQHILIPMGRINLFLAGFNMLPIPGFDGWGFFSGMYRVIFG